MESIKDKVAIVGMGCTKFGERWDKGVEDLLVEAGYEAFEDAGIEPKQIQAAWIGTVFSGFSAITLSPLGLQYIPMTRVENMCATGTEALRAASYAIISGACDVALAIGVEKLKDAGTTGVKGPAIVGDNPDGTSGIGPGYSAPASFAYMATRYFNDYKLKPDAGKKFLAEIAVKNHHNGSLNPKAHFHNRFHTSCVHSWRVRQWLWLNPARSLRPEPGCSPLLQRGKWQPLLRPIRHVGWGPHRPVRHMRCLLHQAGLWLYPKDRSGRRSLVRSESVLCWHRLFSGQCRFDLRHLGQSKNRWGYRIRN